MADEQSGIEVTKTTTVSTGPSPQMQGVERILYLLLGGIAFFSLVLIVVEVFFRTESDVFQVFANVLSAFVGAFLLRVKPPDQK